MRYREGLSGGAGADPVDDGWKDSTHTWNFCGGKIATMVWEDLMAQKCGGDVGTGLADAVIADGAVGSGTSIAGGTGTRSISQSAGARAAQKRKGKKSEDGGERTAAYASVSTLMTTMNATAQLEQDDVKGIGMEELADEVLRLAKKLRDLPEDADEESRETFEELLAEAKEELGAAKARKRAKRAAAEVRI